MKNISIGKILNTTKAYCDFCKEEDSKECVESVIDTSLITSEVNIDFGIFGTYYPVIKNHKQETKIHICFDCIRQLSKLTREKI